MSQVEFIIEVLPEETPVRGNVMASGDGDFDRKVEDNVFASRANGNVWAWCMVKVTARIKGIEGTDYLGCCSYSSERDFHECGHYASMKETALWQLRDELASCSKAVDRSIAGVE